MIILFLLKNYKHGGVAMLKPDLPNSLRKESSEMIILL